MNSLQAPDNGDDNQGSNGFSSTSFIHEFVHRQSVKKVSSGPSVTPSQKLKTLQSQLLTSLCILTPVRLRPAQLRKQLRNYQFEKVQRKIESETLQLFGKGELQLFKQQQNLILILTSVMKEFRSSKDKYFYLLTKKSNRVLHFQHKTNQKNQNIQSILTICSLSQKMSPQLQLYKIPYQIIPTQNGEKIVIKNQAISLFWGKLVNNIIENEKQYRAFYILANFPFPGGSQGQPIQLFNGIQNKKQYSYIGKPSSNIIGQPVLQVFRMKITGLWTADNARNVAETLSGLYGEKFYDIEYQLDRASQLLKEQHQQQMSRKLF